MQVEVDPVLHYFGLRDLHEPERGSDPVRILEQDLAGLLVRRVDLILEDLRPELRRPARIGAVERHEPHELDTIPPIDACAVML